MKNIYKLIITVLLVSIAIIALLMGGAILISDQIKQKIHKSRIGVFELNSGQVSTHLFQRRIILQDVELLAPDSSGHVFIPELSFEGISLTSLLFETKIAITQAVINNARISVNKDLKIGTDDFYERKEKNISIGKLVIKNAGLVIFEVKKGKSDTIFSSGLDFLLEKISKTGINQRYRFRNTSFDRMQLTLNNGRINFPGGLYRMEYNNLQFDSDNELLFVDKIALLSNYKKYEIGQIRGLETDWFDFHINNFEMKGFQLQKLLTDTMLIVAETRIDNFTGEAFKDKRLPFPQKPDTRLPIEMFNAMNIGYHFDSLFIDHASIRYAEHVKGADQAGSVYFSQLKAEAGNLSNIDSLISGPGTMVASARVMNRALLKATFDFPNPGFPVPYRAYGMLGSMPVSSFNPILRHNAFINVKSGQVKTLDFDFFYNNIQSSGSLNFEYDDLHIRILNPGNNKPQVLKSLLVNTLVVHKNNLSTSKNYRQGKISFERDRKKSIFNFWWKSVFSGLQSIAIF